MVESGDLVTSVRKRLSRLLLREVLVEHEAENVFCDVVDELQNTVIDDEDYDATAIVRSSYAERAMDAAERGDVVAAARCLAVVDLLSVYAPDPVAGRISEVSVPQ